ncbi:MAG: type II toxin-antitoxin system RelE/ParE family toxin [Candidatus Binatia bacterium]
MGYTVEIKRSAEREMDRLPDKIHKRISDRILTLETNPRPPGSKKLQVEEGYRLRIGNYRVLYTIDDQTKHIFVYSVAHRREAYR